MLRSLVGSEMCIRDRYTTACPTGALMEHFHHFRIYYCMSYWSPHGTFSPLSDILLHVLLEPSWNIFTTFGYTTACPTGALMNHFQHFRIYYCMSYWSPHEPFSTLSDILLHVLLEPSWNIFTTFGYTTACPTGALMDKFSLVSPFRNLYARPGL